MNEPFLHSSPDGSFDSAPSIKLTHANLFKLSSLLEDRGSTPITLCEDRAIQSIESGVFGVIDGVSAIYHPDDGPALYNGRTGPQSISGIVEIALRKCSKEDSLIQQIMKANRMVRAFLETKIPDFESRPPSELAALTGAFFKVNDGKHARPQTLEIAAWGNAMVLVEFKDGSHWLSEDKVLRFSNQTSALFNQVKNSKVEKYGSWEEAQKETWSEYLTAYELLANQRINNPYHSDGYLMLNGQRAFEMNIYAKQFEIEEVKSAILFTDGLMLEGESLNPDKLAKRFLTNFHKNGGLKGILKSTQDLRIEDGGGTWVKQPSTAAVEIRFPI